MSVNGGMPKFGNMDTQKKINIRSADGGIIMSATINEGAKGCYSLMQHDYIVLPLKLRTPKDFRIGSYVDLRGVFDDALGGKLAKMYYVTENQNPTYNTSTGAYEYDLRLNAYYWLWNNFIFKYTPESTAGEASWSLTAPLDVQMGVFLRNLSELEFTYNGVPYEYSIDSTVEDKAVAMRYDNMHLLDALFSMGGENAWDCDVWVTENVIHFGRCENSDAVKIEIGAEASDMTRNESRGTFATRVYAFGGTRNIPENYRETDNPDLTVNGIVQKRLMLPSGTPYIDAYPDMHPFEAVESVVVFDDIYPKRIGTLSDVRTVDRAVEGEDGEQTGTFKAYQYRDSGLVFDKEYVIPGNELRIVFRSGRLNGLDFGVTFNPENADPAEQLWEIVANEDYGRRLPDETMKPEDGDEYILYGFNIKLVSGQYVPEAEQELKERAQEYVDRTKVDDGTYTVTLRASWVKGDQTHRTFDVGQRVNLVNAAFFGNSGRSSRVIGWEMALDIPYDNPTYTIGESAQYSRLTEIEDRVDSLTFNGQAYQGTGGGSGVYVIRTNDATPASDTNVFSALRSLSTFLRKDREDATRFLLSMYGGAVFGKDGFAPGLAGFGARIDNGGNGEMESLVLRRFLEVPELRYNRVQITLGDKWRAPGAGIIESVDTESRTCTLKLEDGEIGAIDAGDICMGIYHSSNESDNATEDSDDGKGNRKFAGFCTVYFTITEVIGEDNRQFRYQLRPVSSAWAHEFEPFEMMTFVAYGNFTNPERQTSVYETRTYTRMLWKQNTWEIGVGNIAMQTGDLSNLEGQGLSGMDGYSMYANSVYFTGVIRQTKPDGTPIVTANDRGEWGAGHYDYWDRVSHGGCLWLCVNEDGTDAEPVEGNPDWLLQVSRGEDGFGSVTVDLDNENASIGVDADGNVTAGLPLTVGFSMYFGTEDMEITSITHSAPEGVEVTDSAESASSSVTSVSPSAPSSFEVTYTVTGTHGGTPYTRSASFRIIKVKSGADGKDAVLYSLSPSPSAIKVDKDGHLSKPQVDCHVFRTDGSGQTEISSLPEGYSVEKWINGSLLNEYSSGFPLAVAVYDTFENISFRLVKGDELLDEETVPILRDGSDGKDGSGETAVIVLSHPCISVSSSGSVTPTQVWATPQVFTADGMENLPSGWYMEFSDDGGGEWYSYDWKYDTLNTGSEPIWFRICDGGGKVRTQAVIPVMRDGADGQPGEDGKPGSSSVIVYRRSDTKPEKPSGREPEGWSTSVPDFFPGVEAEYNAEGNAADFILLSSGMWASPEGPWQAGTYGTRVVMECDEEFDMELSLSVEYNGPFTATVHGVDGEGTIVTFSDDRTWLLPVHVPAGRHYIDVEMSQADGTDPLDPASRLLFAFNFPKKTPRLVWMSSALVDSASPEWSDPAVLAPDFPQVETIYLRTASEVPYVEVPGPEDPFKNGYTGEAEQYHQEEPYPAGRIVKYGGGYRIFLKAHAGGAVPQDGDWAACGWWTSAPQGVSAEMTCEYESVRRYTVGEGWGAYSVPSLRSLYAAEGLQGIEGCIMRTSEWAEGTAYRNDEKLSEGTRYIDVAMIRDVEAATGWRAFKCLETHVSSSATRPGTEGGEPYWEEFAANVMSVFTSLIIAKNASISFLQGNRLLIMDEDGDVTAGMSGSEEGEAVRFWAGSPSPDGAPYRVTATGALFASSATIEGDITVTKGRVGGFTIRDNKLSYDYTQDDSGRQPSVIINASGSEFFRINETPTVSGQTNSSPFLNIRADSRPAVRITTGGSYADSPTGIYVLCNASGYGKALETYGNVSMTARDGENVTVHGLALHVRSVSSSGSIYSDDDFIAAGASSDITLTLPRSGHTGKLIFVRKTGRGNVTISGGGLSIMPSGEFNGGYVSSVQLVNGQLAILACTGGVWFFTVINN